jgi:hypothetical protein
MDNYMNMNGSSVDYIICVQKDELNLNNLLHKNIFHFHC